MNGKERAKLQHSNFGCISAIRQPSGEYNLNKKRTLMFTWRRYMSIANGTLPAPAPLPTPPASRQLQEDKSVYTVAAISSDNSFAVKMQLGTICRTSCQQ
eukprot:scaffold56886_cov35-Prasinocladus_malaysianus.AAC.1